jgi:1-acyl-sn-glycerol-3-phosphate acyltransferase
MRHETRWTRARVRILAAVSGISLCAWALVMLAVAAMTLGKARRLYAFMAGAFARALLRLWGIHLRIHRAGAWPRGRRVFISNHPSTIDLFALVAIGLPNTRFFLSGFLRKKYIPLGIIAKLMGTFFTVPQTETEERRRIFAAAARELRTTGESVYLSPEGQRVTGGRIGAFNKGAFHMALSLGVPIVPILFVIPEESDPGRGFDIRPGIVHVHVGSEIDTSAWRVESVAAHRDEVHEWFTRWQSDVLAGRHTPSREDAADAVALAAR